jgi:hypothetical protein
MAFTAVPGSPPTPAHLAALYGSWLTDAIIQCAQIRSFDDLEGRQLVGFRGRSGDYQGYGFPYFIPETPDWCGWRLRRDIPDLVYDAQGVPHEKKKYVVAPGSTSQLYFPPGIPPDRLDDATMPVTVVEGEKKCLSLHRLATYDIVTGADNANAARWLAVGIGGVWNWKGTRGKTTNALGKPQPVKGPIPDLDLLVWPGRLVYLCFDSDLDTNNEVRWARLALTRELIRRGALIRWVELKDHNGGPFPAKMGVDDLLAL